MFIATSKVIDLATQKGSAIEGGLVTDEALDSGILKTGLFGQVKGAQQFYAPEQLSKLAANVIDRRMTVLDPTAGNGSLLKSFDHDYRYGIEIDGDQVAHAINGKEEDDSWINPNYYKAIRGDLQQVFPLLLTAAPTFGAIVANPPFGLTWEDPSISDKPLNSAVLTFEYLKKLLHEDGEWMFVCGRDQYYRQIEKLAKDFGVYCVIECDDLFEGTTHPCAIAFGLGTDVAKNGKEVASRKATRDMLDLLPAWVKESRDSHTDYLPRVYSSSNSGTDAAFDAIQREYDVRTEQKHAKKREAEFIVELYNGDCINITLTAFDRLALQKRDQLREVESLRGVNVNYFVIHEKNWNLLLSLEGMGIITIQPRVKDEVEKALAVGKRETYPLYTPNKAQCLGYLSDLDNILCIKDDEQRGFKKGEYYPIKTGSVTLKKQDQRTVQVKGGKRKGEWEIRDVETTYKVMRVRLGHVTFTDSQFTEDQTDIAWMCEHFEIKQPVDLAEAYPEEIAKQEAILDKISAEYLTPRELALKPFQRQDISRLAFKGKGLLSWEQGLGKTVGAAMFAKSMVEQGAQEAVLIVCPLDLIPQWKRELERFFGIKPTVIDGKGYGVVRSSRPFWQHKVKNQEKTIKKCIQAQAQELSKTLRNGGTGWYITHYEGLTTTGTSLTDFEDEVVVMEKPEWKKVKGTDRYGYYSITEVFNEDGTVTKIQVPEESKYDAEGKGREDVHHGWIRYREEKIIRVITSKTLCPQCHADYRKGWNGKYCEAEDKNGSVCGYAHYKHRVKSAASFLSTAFRKGVLILDEGTYIQGDTSKRSMAIRGLNSRHTLLLTGTPIKNYIKQAYWLLWKCLGNNSRAFPYPYEQGQVKFENDFAVWEQFTSRSTGTKGTKKAIPEITNLSKLWRLLTASSIRRRKEDTGEYIVPRIFHVVNVPLGRNQQRAIHSWLKNFPTWFIDTHPDSPIQSIGTAEFMAPMIGLNQKIDWASTLPEGDKTGIDWLNERGADITLSNYTPNNLRTLELALALAKKGEKVLIGSNLVLTGKWIAERLQDKGVKARHILNESDETMEAVKRAAVVYDLQTNDTQVLCTGVKAIRLGHNLDACSAVILNGLDWDFETFDQFINRIHRMTSEKPVHVYTIIPNGAITERKWTGLGLKGASSNLALDGKLIEKHEEQVNADDVMRDMMERGVPLVGDEVDEVDIEDAWKLIPQLDLYEIPEGLLTNGDVVLTDFGEPVIPVPSYEQVWGSVTDPKNIYGITIPPFPSTVTNWQEAVAPVLPEPEPEPDYTPIPPFAGIEVAEDGSWTAPDEEVSPEPEPEPEPEPVEEEPVVEEEVDDLVAAMEYAGWLQ